MNADIQKYRVWNEYTSMYDSSFIVDQDGEVYRMIDCCENGYDIIHYSENVVVERCSGLRDKNGNLIYAGDVVRFCNVIMLVEWSGASCRFVLKYLEKNHPLYGYRMSMCLPDDITFFRNEYEIIGNIHEMEKDK